ncbi:NF-kappa-B inhibitor beta [Paroedura picta]|uniref:NF-kappa-B inhibitor beta n=1 Tax=Paroedura picta TaxID=143630 RepID=UPI00405728D9
MASWSGPGAPGGEAKRRASVGEEWCDSGLGSLSEGQLRQLQAEEAMEGGGASERLDSALGDSLAGLVEGVGAVRLEGQPQQPQQERGEEEEAKAAVDPEAWLHHVLAFATEDGDTALHLAVIHEHEAFLDSILQYTEGTDYLDVQNDLGQTALHIAVILDASDFVGKLVSAGAGLCMQEKGGHTALHLACREGRRECAQHLLAPPASQRSCHGNGFRAQLDCTNYDGYTPLHVAVLRKDLEMVNLLVAAGADLNKPELSCGRSPLHLAVESQNPEVVEYLLRAGADPEARMYVGYTPMYSAVHRPDQKIPQLLREFGSEEPDWESEESLDSNSEEEYDDIVIKSGR